MFQPRIACLVVLLLALLLPVLAAAQTQRVAKNWLRLRKDPGPEGKAIALLYGNDQVEQEDASDGWIKVRTASGLTGWVPAAGLKPLASATATVAKPDSPQSTPQSTAEKSDPGTSMVEGAVVSAEQGTAGDSGKIMAEESAAQGTGETMASADQGAGAETMASSTTSAADQGTSSESMPAAPAGGTVDTEDKAAGVNTMAAATMGPADQGSADPNMAAAEQNQGDKEETADSVLKAPAASEPIVPQSTESIADRNQHVETILLDRGTPAYYDAVSRLAAAHGAQPLPAPASTGATSGQLAEAETRASEVLTLEGEARIRENRLEEAVAILEEAYGLNADDGNAYGSLNKALTLYIDSLRAADNQDELGAAIVKFRRIFPDSQVPGESQ